MPGTHEMRGQPVTPATLATVRPAIPADAARIAQIYNHFVRETVVTFEEEAVGEEAMASRLEETAQAKLPWVVAEEAGTVNGFAYASKWKGRCAYRHTVESTVYLDPAAKGRGLGTKLYAALFEQLRELRVHVVIGGIALPNEESIALHEKFGMRKVAHFKEVGFKFGRWIDVGYWQVELQAR